MSTPKAAVRRKLTYGKLPVTPFPNVRLFCAECQQEYSAAGGDYFDRKQDEAPTCGVCGARLSLVRRVTRLVRISVEQAGAR